MTRMSLRSRRHVRVRTALVIGDNRSEVEKIIATLRVVVGFASTIRAAATANAAVAEVMACSPDFVIMDDMLLPNDTAVTVIPLLRQAGYAGPIIVASRVTTPARTEALCKAGAGLVIRKDNLCSGDLFATLVGFGLAEELEINANLGSDLRGVFCEAARMSASWHKAADLQSGIYVNYRGLSGHR